MMTNYTHNAAQVPSLKYSIFMKANDPHMGNISNI